MADTVIGLALGSGGAKGFAHIGVLRALEEHEIPIHVVTGSSMGSLVGALYVTGMRPQFMERLAASLHMRHWLDLVVPKVGLVAGEKVHEMLRLLTHNATFEELERPFACVATDLLHRRKVILNTGNVADAVRASISIPGVFVPVVTEEGVLVDGGVLDRVPVAAARQLGADVVIGVDVSAAHRARVPETVLDVVTMSIDVMQEYSLRAPDNVPDVAIEPDVSDIGTSQFHRSAEAAAAGYAAAVASIPKIRAALDAAKNAS
ncbi:patatin-like phospholipase family protein [Alicyclobacillus macrosporangiidus]|uniref:patatin-like phospholipase family protein n=1 Tax=Alicyclobacillus macrosporangiidus TaxID=392015 RepID=UPI0004963146|nr:patatin-like phospholipase family protein [Alicyclobacillus macrosporangiidus]